MKDYSKDLENRVLTLRTEWVLLMKNGSALDEQQTGSGSGVGNSLKA